jgi:hypothetical protein
MDSYNVGDEINVVFNVTGRLWTGPDNVEKCFNSLKAWKIGPLNTNQHDSYASPQAVPSHFVGGDDDIPF